MYHRLENHFVRSQWNSYVMWVMSNLILVHVEKVLVLVQDRCTVALNVEIILAPDGSPC
jgi:hypothetical protein